MKTSPTARLLIMGVILMALNVPLTMMCGVVSERTARRNQVAAEVSESWGGAQTIGGPVLTVPYRYSWTDGAGRVESAITSYNVLPETLEIDGVVEPGERKRSLFTVIVYTARLKIRGRFAAPKMADLRPVPDAILWDRASVSLGVSDPRGIARAIDAELERPAAAIRPGLGAHRTLRFASPGASSRHDRRANGSVSLRARCRSQRHARAARDCRQATKQSYV